MMSVGDPDLATIERIIEHAVTSLYRGRTHYSPGMGELNLRQTIADIETQASGKLTSPEQVSGLLIKILARETFILHGS